MYTNLVALKIAQSGHINSFPYPVGSPINSRENESTRREPRSEERRNQLELRKLEFSERRRNLRRTSFP